MRTLALVAVLAAGCGSTLCNDGTVLLTIGFDSASAQADSIEVALSLGGGALQRETVARTEFNAIETLEVQFNGYPAGQTMQITVVAKLQNTPVAAGSTTRKLDPGCTAMSLSLHANNLDLSASDQSRADLRESD